MSQGYFWGEEDDVFAQSLFFFSKFNPKPVKDSNQKADLPIARKRWQEAVGICQREGVKWCFPERNVSIDGELGGQENEKGYRAAQRASLGVGWVVEGSWEQVQLQVWNWVDGSWASFLSLTVGGGVNGQRS